MAFVCSSNDNHFTGYDEPTVEVEDKDLGTQDSEEGSGELAVTVRVVRPCAGCGQDQAETTLEFNTSFEHECPDETWTEGDGTKPEYEEELADRTFELKSVDAEPADEYQTKDRHGKQIKNSRYQRHLIGASITATVTCSRCDGEIEVTDEQTEAASSFDDQGSH